MVEDIFSPAPATSTGMIDFLGILKSTMNLLDPPKIKFPQSMGYMT